MNPAIELNTIKEAFANNNVTIEETTTESGEPVSVLCLTHKYLENGILVSKPVPFATRITPPTPHKQPAQEIEINVGCKVKTRQHKPNPRKLNRVLAYEIRDKYATGLFSQDELADHYGVSPQNISSVINNKSWK